MKAMPSSKHGLRGPILSVALFSVVSNILMLVSPIYLTQVYDRILPTRSVETLLYLSLIAVTALALFGLIETVRQTLGRKIAARYELLVLPKVIGSADNGSTQFDGSITSNAGTVKRFLGSTPFISLFDLPFMPLFLALMFIAHPLLGALTACGMVTLVVVALFNDWLSRRPSADLSRAQAFAARSARDALAVQEDVRAMGMARAMSDRWLNHALHAAQANDSAGAVNASFFGLTRFVRQCLQTAIIGTGAWLVIHGDMSPSLIFAASIVSSRALMPIEQLVGSWKMIAEARRAHKEVKSVLAEVDKAASISSRVNLPKPEGHISAFNLSVTAGSGPDAPVIVDGVSFKAKPGQLNVIVGASGSGKSTLLRLLSGATAPTSGEIRLDGFKLPEWPAETRGRAFGYMPQQITLFEGTVAQNIARFDPEATDEAIINAARRSQAHEFIATLPDGYNTQLGPGQIRLSGGQVQRLALARALHTNPAVLVLDEPNANLDSQGEEALMNVLLSERDNGRTLIVATHRPNLLGIADAVFVMDRGKLKTAAKGPARQTSSSPLSTIISSTSTQIVKNQTATPSPRSAS